MISISSDLVQIINAISTIALAIFTGVYVYVTFRILKSNNRILLEQMRPYVSVHFFQDDLRLKLSLENSGKTIARDVVVKFEPCIDCIVSDDVKGKFFTSPFLQQSMIAPNSRLICFVDFTPQFIEKNKVIPVFDVQIHYYDDERNDYSNEFKIDLNSLIYEGKDANMSTEAHLKAISKSLKNMADTVKVDIST